MALLYWRATLCSPVYQRKGKHTKGDIFNVTTDLLALLASQVLCSHIQDGFWHARLSSCALSLLTVSESIIQLLFSCRRKKVNNFIRSICQIKRQSSSVPACTISSLHQCQISKITALLGLQRPLHI